MPGTWIGTEQTYVQIEMGNSLVRGISLEMETMYMIFPCPESDTCLNKINSSWAFFKGVKCPNKTSKQTKFWWTYSGFGVCSIQICLLWWEGNVNYGIWNVCWKINDISIQWEILLQLTKYYLEQTNDYISLPVIIIHNDSHPNLLFLTNSNFSWQHSSP